MGVCFFFFWGGGVLKFQIFFGKMPEIPDIFSFFFFFLGGGGVQTVDAGSKPTYYEKMRPPSCCLSDRLFHAAQVVVSPMLLEQ